jgi:hypothetical protein
MMHRHLRDKDWLMALLPALFASLVLLMAAAKKGKMPLKMWR